MVNKNTWKLFYFKDKYSKKVYCEADDNLEYAKRFVAFNIWRQDNPNMYLEWKKNELDLSIFKEMLDDIRNDLKEISEEEYEKNKN